MNRVLRVLVFLFYSFIQAQRSCGYGDYDRYQRNAQGCTNPKALGMENGEILSSQIKASSTWSSFHRAALSRLNSEAGFGRSGAWSAGYSNRNQWLQVDFKEQTTITGISTQGRQDMRQWVKQYVIWYSNDGVKFHPYRRKNGWVKLFQGNKDRNSVVRHDFTTPIVTRYIRVQPVSWHGFISMRVEFYGCRKIIHVSRAPRCINPKALGMEKGEILSNQLRASSTWSFFHRAALGRLNSEAGFGRSGAWSAGYSNRNQWLQVDFKEQTTITGISTQGRQDMRQWVKQYIIWYSNNGVRFYPYRRKNGWVKIFQGNTDQNSVVRHDFFTPIVARFVRVHPVSWHGFISMRVEFYGCRKPRKAPGCINPKALGMEKGEILSSQIKASSRWSSFHRAALSRLNSEAGFGRSGAWSAGYSNRNQWLQVDFIEQTTITGISTQGRQDMRQWVKQYIIWYSNDGVRFYPYRRKNGWVKIFQGNTDQNSVVRHDFTTPIVSRYVRVRPVSWHGFISMRVEFYGCRKGILTTSTPRTTLATTQTPLVPKWTNWPKTTTHTPALTFTTSPTRAALITPPLPPTDSLLPPPVPPTIKTTKPPPPPSNKDVKCGTKGRVGRVVNGTESAAGSWPWQVGIKTCPDCNITCGGTLIKSEWVATAAHCVSDWFPEELYLVAGEIDQAVRSGHEQEFRCDKIIVHEQYGRAAPYDKDIALVRLSKYAVFNDHVRPLCLPKTNSVLTDKDLCTVTGFGRVKQSGLKSALLLQANVIVVNHDTCKKAYASLDPPRPVTKNMFCAGFEQGGTDACQGDSGGPLTCFDRRNAKFMLGGVVSWGVGCAQAKQYGVYTNVASFTSWIQKEMAKH